MKPRNWILPLLATFASGQEPFPAEPAGGWSGTGELVLRGDRLTIPDEPALGFRRAGVELRTRWTWEAEPFRWVMGVRGALGTDPNGMNVPRWDQEPSNGLRLDAAHADLSWVAAQSFGSLKVGLHGNTLLSAQALWDPDLRILGAGGTAALRGASGPVQEASLRAEAGRVRTLIGGEVDLTAGQAVLKLDAGPLSWVGHAGRWRLSWEAGPRRQSPLKGHDPKARQVLEIEAAGLSVTWHAVLPVEVRAFACRNPGTGDGSEEAQLILGGRERAWRPQLAFTWQRLSATGTLYPVNGDEWWYYRRAEGPRLDLLLPLPGRWTVRLAHLRQKPDGEGYWVPRTMLTATRRF